MASESDASTSSLFERLMAMPMFADFVTSVPESESDSNHGSENSIRQSIDRIILFNPVTQAVMVIGGSGTDFDSVLNDLVRKEGNPPASQASIDGMPVTEVKGTDEIESLGGECVICLEEWRVGDVAKEMPCKHKFHGSCVDRWLKVHGSCPLCRHKMPATEDLDKKIGDESRGIRRRRAILVTFGVGNNGRSTSEIGSLNGHLDESVAESDES